MSILDRPAIHLSADDVAEDAPLTIRDMVDIVRETLDAFLDGHLDLAARNVTVAPAGPLFAGMLRVTVDGQRFDLTVTEAP